MPSISQAQFGKMGRLFKQGKISKKTLEEFNKGVNPKELPKHAKKQQNRALRGRS